MSAIVFGMEILRNRKRHPDNKHLFFMSDLPYSAMLILIIVTIVLNDAYENFFLLLTGMYALLQAVAITIMLYGLKIEIVRETDKVRKN